MHARPRPRPVVTGNPALSGDDGDDAPPRSRASAGARRIRPLSASERAGAVASGRHTTTPRTPRSPQVAPDASSSRARDGAASSPSLNSSGPRPSTQLRFGNEDDDPWPVALSECLCEWFNVHGDLVTFRPGDPADDVYDVMDLADGVVIAAHLGNVAEMGKVFQAEALPAGTEPSPAAPLAPSGRENADADLLRAADGDRNSSGNGNDGAAADGTEDPDDDGAGREWTASDVRRVRGEDVGVDDPTLGPRGGSHGAAGTGPAAGAALSHALGKIDAGTAAHAPGAGHNGAVIDGAIRVHLPRLIVRAGALDRLGSEQVGAPGSTQRAVTARALSTVAAVVTLAPAASRIERVPAAMREGLARAARVCGFIDAERVLEPTPEDLEIAALTGGTAGARAKLPIFSSEAELRRALERCLSEALRLSTISEEWASKQPSIAGVSMLSAAIERRAATIPAQIAIVANEVRLARIANAGARQSTVPRKPAHGTEASAGRVDPRHLRASLPAAPPSVRDHGPHDGPADHGASSFFLTAAAEDAGEVGLFSLDFGRGGGGGTATVSRSPSTASSVGPTVHFDAPDRPWLAERFPPASAAIDASRAVVAARQRALLSRTVTVFVSDRGSAVGLRAISEIRAACLERGMHLVWGDLDDAVSSAAATLVHHHQHSHHHHDHGHGSNRDDPSRSGDARPAAARPDSPSSRRGPPGTPRSSAAVVGRAPGLVAAAYASGSANAFASAAWTNALQNSVTLRERLDALDAARPLVVCVIDEDAEAAAVTRGAHLAPSNDYDAVIDAGRPWLHRIRGASIAEAEIIHAALWSHDAGHGTIIARIPREEGKGNQARRRHLQSHSTGCERLHPGSGDGSPRPETEDSVHAEREHALNLLRTRDHLASIRDLMEVTDTVSRRAVHSAVCRTAADATKHVTNSVLQLLEHQFGRVSDEPRREAAHAQWGTTPDSFQVRAMRDAVGALRPRDAVLEVTAPIAEAVEAACNAVSSLNSSGAAAHTMPAAPSTSGDAGAGDAVEEEEEEEEASIGEAGSGVDAAGDELPGPGSAAATAAAAHENGDSPAEAEKADDDGDGETDAAVAAAARALQSKTCAFVVAPPSGGLTTAALEIHGRLTARYRASHKVAVRIHSVPLDRGCHIADRASVISHPHVPVMRRIMHELSEHLGLGWFAPRKGVSCAAVEDAFAMAMHTLRGRDDDGCFLVMVIDHLDAACGADLSLSWLPDSLPRSLRIVATVSAGGCDRGRRVRRSLAARGWAPVPVRLATRTERETHLAVLTGLAPPPRGQVDPGGTGPATARVVPRWATAISSLPGAALPGTLERIAAGAAEHAADGDLGRFVADLAGARSSHARGERGAGGHGSAEDDRASALAGVRAGTGTVARADLDLACALACAVRAQRRFWTLDGVDLAGTLLVCAARTLTGVHRADLCDLLAIPHASLAKVLASVAAYVEEDVPGLLRARRAMRRVVSRADTPDGAAWLRARGLALPSPRETHTLMARHFTRAWFEARTTIMGRAQDGADMEAPSDSTTSRVSLIANPGKRDPRAGLVVRLFREALHHTLLAHAWQDAVLLLSDVDAMVTLLCANDAGGGFGGAASAGPALDDAGLGHYVHDLPTFDEDEGKTDRGAGRGTAAETDGGARGEVLAAWRCIMRHSGHAQHTPQWAYASHIRALGVVVSGGGDTGGGAAAPAQLGGRTDSGVDWTSVSAASVKRHLVIAGIVRDCGDLVLAESVLRALVSRTSGLLGEDDPHTTQARLSLARFLAKRATDFSAPAARPVPAAIPAAAYRALAFAAGSAAPTSGPGGASPRAAPGAGEARGRSGTASGRGHGFRSAAPDPPAAGGSALPGDAAIATFAGTSILPTAHPLTEAGRLLDAVIVKMRQTRPGDPGTARAMKEAASLRFGTGDIARAADLMTEARGVLEDVLGIEHPTPTACALVAARARMLAPDCAPRAARWLPRHLRPGHLIAQCAVPGSAGGSGSGSGGSGSGSGGGGGGVALSDKRRDLSAMPGQRASQRAAAALGEASLLLDDVRVRLEKCVATFTIVRGARHPHTAIARRDLGLLLLEAGKNRAAEKCLAAAATDLAAFLRGTDALDGDGADPKGPSASPPRHDPRNGGDENRGDHCDDRPWEGGDGGALVEGIEDRRTRTAAGAAENGSSETIPREAPALAGMPTRSRRSHDYGVQLGSAAVALAAAREQLDDSRGARSALSCAAAEVKLFVAEGGIGEQWIAFTGGHSDVAEILARHGFSGVIT